MFFYNCKIATTLVLVFLLTLTPVFVQATVKGGIHKTSPLSKTFLGGETREKLVVFTAFNPDPVKKVDRIIFRNHGDVSAVETFYIFVNKWQVATAPSTDRMEIFLRGLSAVIFPRETVTITVKADISFTVQDGEHIQISLEEITTTGIDSGVSQVSRFQGIRGPRHLLEADQVEKTLQAQIDDLLQTIAALNEQLAEFSDNLVELIPVGDLTERQTGYVKTFLVPQSFDIEFKTFVIIGNLKNPNEIDQRVIPSVHSKLLEKLNEKDTILVIESNYAKAIGESVRDLDVLAGRKVWLVGATSDPATYHFEDSDSITDRLLRRLRLHFPMPLAFEESKIELLERDFPEPFLWEPNSMLTPVTPLGKIATTWGQIKKVR